MSADNGRDEAWFDALFRDHHGVIRGYPRRRVAGADVDDVVVEVFATAWACRAQLPSDPLPWLYRCAWYRVLALHRAESRRAHLLARVAGDPTRLDGGHDGGAAGGYAGPPGAGAEGADLDWVHAVLAALDPDEAELLRLAAWEGLAPREIAAVLGCTPGAARVRLHRARRKAEALCPPGRRSARGTAPSTLAPAANPAPHDADHEGSRS